MENPIRHLITIILTLSVLSTLFAQSPEKMSFQAVARDQSGNLVSQQQISVRISIIKDSPSSNPIFSEVHQPLSNKNGLVTLIIGEGDILLGALSSIDWNDGSYFIQTETDISGGNNFTISGVTQMLSVPYALHANTANSVNGYQSGNAFNHYIGEEFGGGVIFHLWRGKDGSEHGLIVDLIEISQDESWSNNWNTLIGANAQSTWNGQQNSLAIIDQPSHNSSAASLCIESTNNGFDDWYLPAKDELVNLWYNRFNINQSLSGIQDSDLIADTGYYVSSTENDKSYAWVLLMNGGSPRSIQKSAFNGNTVRCVRKF